MKRGNGRSPSLVYGPKFDLPKIIFPKINMPYVELPRVKTPVINLPKTKELPIKPININLTHFNNIERSLRDMERINQRLKKLPR